MLDFGDAVDDFHFGIAHREPLVETIVDADVHVFVDRSGDDEAARALDNTTGDRFHRRRAKCGTDSER